MKKLPLTITLFALLYSCLSNATVHTITQSGFTFSPNSLSVLVGDTIKWQWTEGSHTTTSKSIPQGATSWDAELNGNNRTFLYKVLAAGSHTYVCTPHEGMGMTGSFNASNPTNILNNTNNSFVIFPNPASNQINIKDNIHLNEISIYNTIGNLVHKRTFTDVSDKQTIDISNLPAGIYIVSIMSVDGKRKTQKLKKTL